MSELHELQYQIPPDVLHYEPRFFFGLTATDLLVAAMPTILLMAAVGVIPGLLAGVVAISLLKRFDSFGNRSFPVYYFQRWQYIRAQRPVTLPLVLPGEAQPLAFETWKGEELFKIETESA